MAPEPFERRQQERDAAVIGADIIDVDVRLRRDGSAGDTVEPEVIGMVDALRGAHVSRIEHIEPVEISEPLLEAREAAEPVPMIATAPARIASRLLELRMGEAVGPDHQREIDPARLVDGPVDLVLHLLLDQAAFVASVPDRLVQQVAEPLA